jgi:hypothetical protein
MVFANEVLEHIQDQDRALQEIYIRLRSCRPMDAIVRTPLPSGLPEALPYSRAPSLRGRYPASSLLRAPPPPSRRPPTSQERWL